MTRPGPGKFEGNESLEISEFLHDVSLNGFQSDSLGDVEHIGFHDLILDADRRIGAPLDVKQAYILSEDNNGFVTYREFDTNRDASLAWTDYQNAMDELERESDAY